MQLSPSRTIVRGLAAALLASAAGAREFPSSHPFPGPGEGVQLGFSGAPEDFVIPDLGGGTVLRLSVKGGNGGNANPNDKHCESSGGRGAILTADFVVGTGTDELEPGGILRYLVGQAGGEDDHHNHGAAGGGGGGTGILYLAPSSDTWEPLLVAGGGGGAGQTVSFGACNAGNNGVDASLSPHGTTGNNNDAGAGGTNGNGGYPGSEDGFDLGSGGGGGLYTNQLQILTPQVPFSPNWSGIKGYPAGGAGGFGSGGSGGWGCGGGGGGRGQDFFATTVPMGGGGGGYSGGGGGGDTEWNGWPQGGGGGGSFVAPFAEVLQMAVYTGASKDGFASLTSLGSAPTCDGAIEIFAEPVQRTTVLVDGAIGDAVPSMSFSCEFGFNLAGPDLWYEFTNDLPVDRAVTFRNLSLLPLFVEQHSQCGPGQLDACGDASAPGGVTFTVPRDATRSFRVETAAAGFQPGAPFTLEVTFEALGPDSDGDGVIDLFDVCSGDDSKDSDQDGIPDACDGCNGPGADCDGNGIQDACDLVGFPRRLELFNEHSMPGGVAVSGDAGFVPAVVGDDLQVGGTTDGASLGSAVFEPVSPTRIDAFAASFYARIEPSPLPSNGLSFSVFDADQHGPETVLGAAGAPSGLSLVLGNGGSASGKDVELRYDGTLFASADVPFELDDGAWRRFHLEVDGGAAYVWIVESGQGFLTVIDGAAIPGFQPYRARFGFGTLSVTGGSDPGVFVDDVSFADWSGLYDRDIDDNGVLDSCELPELTVVAGSPANPEVLAPVTIEVPTMGTTYELHVDHAAFHPGALLDVLYVSLAQVDVPLPPAGTLLVRRPPAVQRIRPAGAAIPLPIPYDPTLFELPLTFQAVSLDPLAVGQEILFTNALVSPVAGWHPGY